MNTNTKKIRVVLLEPDKLARITDIDATLEGMQKVVKGNIEAFYPFEEPVCIVCNEEGKISGMRLNRAVYDEGPERKMIEIVPGPCFICDCSGEDFKSLSESQLQKYKERFKYPERFIKNGSEIMAFPFSPKEQER